MSASKRLTLVALAVSLVFLLIPTAAASCGPTCGSHATASSSPSGTGTHLYRCPMHAEVTSDGPSKCPKCGMALEAVKPASVQRAYVCETDGYLSDAPGKCPKCGMALKEVNRADVHFQCPMDKDVVTDKPGKCPKCGMTLKMQVKIAPAPDGPPKAHTTWRSTMNPNEASDHPGKDSMGMEMVPFAPTRRRSSNQDPRASK